MSSPPRPPTSLPTANPLSSIPSSERIDSIKQYYQQLCSNCRLLTQQLQHPDLPPTRRPLLQTQLDKVQVAIQDFTEKVIKPLMASGGISPMGSPLIGINTTNGGQTSVPTPLVPPPVTPPTITVATRPVVRPNPPSRLSQPPLSRSGSIINGSAAGGSPRTPISLLAKMPTHHVDPILLDLSNKPSKRPLLLSPHYKRQVSLTDLMGQHFSSYELSVDSEELIYSMIDQYINIACQCMCELAVHRRRSTVTVREMETVLEKIFGQSITAASLPIVPLVPIVPSKSSSSAAKKGTSANTHQARMAQLRKHLAILSQYQSQQHSTINFSAPKH